MGTPVIALIGYTNVGKTALLNKFAKVDFDSRDQLFMTLHTVSKRVNLRGS